jgi:hypothetical protein
MNEEQLNYWYAYLESIGAGKDDFYVEASIAGDDSIASELLDLYLQGKKNGRK